jgi:hypothetical protein
MNGYKNLVLASLLTSLFAGPLALNAQSSNAERTREILATFTKHKDVTKERRGIRVSKYKDVRSEAYVPRNLESLSGRYIWEDWGLSLNLKVDREGRVTGTGDEPLYEGVKRQFTLENGRINGALFTATKVFANGRRQPFEGAFLNMTTRESPTDRGITTFGLGVVGPYIEISGYTMNRFFYRKTS